MLGDTEVVDDSEAHLVVGLYICTLNRQLYLRTVIMRTANMILAILLKLKPFAPLARAFSLSVASISSLRTASLLGESPESVSSKNVGDFGIALCSFLAFFRISSASSTKVGEL